MSRLRYPFRYTALIFGLGVLFTILFFQILYGGNALKVEHDGITETVRWPNAYTYNTGDSISIPQEDGSYYTATVVDVVTLPTPIVDDERKEGGLLP